jgi:Mg-chelatase subunit ChlD
MSKPPSKIPDPRATALIHPGKLSPWLQAMRDATGIDPRSHQAGATTMLVLDRSGSMSGPSIVEALAGARKFDRDAVAGGQALGLIVFASEATLVAEPSRKGIAAHLEAVHCDGGTNMAAAISLATSHLEGVRGKRTMVIATDGHPSDPKAAIEAAHAAKRLGIRIITIGTSAADAEFLRKLASADNMTMSARPGELGKAIAHASRLLLK